MCATVRYCDTRAGRSPISASERRALLTRAELERVDEWEELVLAGMQPAVHKEHGSVSYSIFVGQFDVVGDAPRRLPGSEVSLEDGHVDREPLGEFPEGAVREVLRMVEQPIVHEPELSLETGRLRGLGSGLGSRMGLGLRIVPEREAQVVAQFTDDLANGGDRMTAMDGFVVPVLDERVPSVERADHMIARVNGQHKLGEFLVHTNHRDPTRPNMTLSPSPNATMNR